MGYPFIEAVLSVLPIVDEFLINDGGSSDDTPKYLKKLQNIFPKKINIFNKNYYPSKCWETIDDCIDFLISQAKGDWIFEIQGDEIWHEKEVLLLKKIIEEIHQKGYNSLRCICHWSNFNKITSYKYRNVRIVRKIEGLKSYWGGDDFHIYSYGRPSTGFTSSNVPPEKGCEIKFFNLYNTFPKNDFQRVKTIAQFFAKEDQERQDAFLNYQEISDCNFNLEVVAQLPALIRGLVGSPSYYIREELFDKNFLKRLTGLSYNG